MSRARQLSRYIPPAGDAGFSLIKASNDDYDIGWANVAGGGGSLPPIIPTTDRGKSLVVAANDLPTWGAIIDNATQIIDGGDTF